MSTVTIYHNPKCSTSRNALALLRERGIEPQVVEYLKTPPSRDELQRIAAATGEPLRALLRTKQPEYLEQGLDDPQLSDDQLLDAMLATPVLINRPIVVSAKGARPSGGTVRNSGMGTRSRPGRQRVSASATGCVMSPNKTNSGTSARSFGAESGLASWIGVPCNADIECPPP